MTERTPKAPIPERIASFPNRQIIYLLAVSCGQQRRLMVQLDPNTGDLAKRTTPKENSTNEVQKNPGHN